MQVRLLTHRVANVSGTLASTVNYEGDVIDVPDEEAVRLIDDGQAEAVAAGEGDRRTRRIQAPKETR